jgi:hypothetical protein
LSIFMYAVCEELDAAVIPYSSQILPWRLCRKNSAENSPEDSRFVPVKHRFFIECKIMLICIS